jgi:IS605 OrfB family transposase
MADLRTIASPFVAPGPCGVAIRDRLKGLTVQDEKVLWLVGEHIGSLASRDLKARCSDGLDHGNEKWAARKRELTAVSSSRWAGSVTKATHDQWALARRGLSGHIHNLEAGIGTLRHRLSLPLGEKGTKRAPGGYRSRAEWFAKSRRLACLQDRHAKAVADWRSGRVRVVRGGKRLARARANLVAARLTAEQWRARWEAARLFLSADGESGKRFGNETIRITGTGEVSIKLPSPFAHLANAPHGRYALACRVSFQHRGVEWGDRIDANRAVAYTIHHDPQRGRWYVTASWQRAAAPVIAVDAALASGVIGVDTNNDHYAAWLLDTCGNPVGDPRRFDYDMRGSADSRDAQIRHATTRLLNWAKQCGVSAIAIENLDFTDGKTREKHGRRKQFRQLISRFPTAELRSRLVSMATETGIAIIAVDPAYTSRWGAEYWAKPTSTPTRKTTRHEAASLVIGRRAQGHHARRRTPPPPRHQSDDMRHRSAQAGQGNPVCEEPRPPRTGTRTRSVHPPGT